MNEEELVRIQKILTWSDIHPSNCTKINDLITRLSKENKQLQNNWNELKSWLEEEIKEYQKDKYPSDYGLVLGFIQVTQQKMQELEQGKDE